MQDAMGIYQEVLDHTGAALISGDAEGFLRHIFLPCTLLTDSETVVIDDPGLARRHYDGFHRALKAQNVDAYTRIVRQAAFETANRITGQHETFITSRGKLVVPRFSNEMQITLRGGIWGMEFVRHHTRYVAWPEVLPRGGQAHD